MLSRNLKTITLSFAAGALLTGSFWLGVENAGSFQKPSVPASSLQAANTSASSAIKPVLLESGSHDHVISNMVKQAGPAVVKIETQSTVQSTGRQGPFSRRFFGGGGSQIQQALGSGFIISQDGYILTNNHVVEGADSIQVTLSGDSNKYDGKVIGTDPNLDLAVVKITADKSLPTLKLGDSNQIAVGEWSVAIGNPYGLDHTVTVGVISAKGRPLDIGQARFKDLLQTDTSINPGNSGGPLLNLNGEVIGINTAINAEAQGIGFAIPINTVKGVLDQLIEKGSVAHPWLGVSLQDMTPQIAQEYNLDQQKGAIVGLVADGSPAEKAGIQAGDIIVEMDKQKVDSSEELADKIAGAKAGEKHGILVVREGQMIPLTVVIGNKN